MTESVLLIIETLSVGKNSAGQTAICLTIPSRGRGRGRERGGDGEGGLRGEKEGGRGGGARGRMEGELPNG